MIVCSGADLVSRVRHPSQRFYVPRHLPFNYATFLPDKIAWFESLLVDLFLLLIVGSMIHAARSRIERGLYVALLGCLLVPPLRYFLPGIAVPLWWVGSLLSVLLLLTGVALLAEVNREAADKVAQPQ
jgi:hypothetical protein